MKRRWIKRKSSHGHEWAYFIEDGVPRSACDIAQGIRPPLVAAVAKWNGDVDDASVADMIVAAPEMFHLLDLGAVIPTGEFAGRFMVDAQLVTAAMMKARGLGEEDMKNDNA